MNLSDDQKMIRKTPSNIAEKELAPMAAEVDRKQIFPKHGVRKLAEAGFPGMTVPEDLGGGGADTLSFVLATEAIAKGCASTASIFNTQEVVTRAVVIAGSDKQKSRLLTAIIKGDRLGAFAANEPSSGSNPFAIAPKAVSDGDHLVVNGSKTLIHCSGEAEIYLIVLRTDQARNPTDLSLLIVEKGATGFLFGKKEDNMGLRGTSDGELIFQDCRVPKANLLGAESGFLAIFPDILGLAMLGAAGIALGIAHAAADAAIGHAKTRQVAGAANRSISGGSKLSG